MNIKRNSRYKSRGSILVITALAAIVWIFIAQSLFIVGAGGFGMIKSSRVALQAQQYAEIEVDRLKNVAYENLDSDGAHSRQVIANIQESGWEDEVSIGPENTISGSDDVKQRIATVNVYKSGDTLSRFTLEVPLSSQSSNPNKAFDFYWIDTTMNYYRTLQLAVKYNGVEYILHDFSSRTIPSVNIVVNGPTGNGLGGSSGIVQIGDQYFNYDNKWRSKAYIEAYLRNTYMPEHNMAKVYYSGVIIPPPDNSSTVDISGIVER